MGEDSFIVVGKIVKAHGIKGEVQVYPYSEPHFFPNYKTIFLKRFNEQLPKKVLKTRFKKAQSVILALEGIVDRIQAQVLAGKEIYVEKACLPVLDHGEYYYYELEGLSVWSAQGENLGVLSYVLTTRANDVYVVKGSRSEIMVPAVEHVVKKVDLDKGVMIVDLPPDLVDLNVI